MIEHLKGLVTSIHEKGVTLTIGESVGFFVYCGQPERFALGTPATFLIYFNWSQDRGPALYGFESALGKTVFEMLIGCPKIGPSIAMAILSQMTPHDCLRAMSKGDARALSNLNGIGAKKAAQIITDLQEKSGTLLMTLPATEQTSDNEYSLRGDVAQALVSLGYSKQEITQALQAVDGGESFDKILRTSLAFLSKAKNA